MGNLRTNNPGGAVMQCGHEASSILIIIYHPNLATICTFM